MHRYLEDILENIDKEPQWFDENAVPRYCAFGPDQVADIYANEVAYVLIRCQGCQHPFKVAFSRSSMDDAIEHARGNKTPRTLEMRVKDKSIHYGDPPNIRCCPSGPTMNSDPIQVLEFWERKHMDWRRRPDLEGALDDEG